MSMISKLQDLKNNKDSLDYNSYYQAKVVDNNDPLKLQRVKFRLKVLHRNIEDLDLPWATPIIPLAQGNNGGIGSISVPSLGSDIFVQFLDDYNIVYTGYLPTDNTKVPDLVDTNYPNSYGFVDASGNKFFVDTLNDTVTFTHLSGTQLFIDQVGNLTIIAKDNNLNINGNVNLKSSGNLNISCQEFNIDSDKTTIKSNNVSIEAKTLSVSGDTSSYKSSGSLVVAANSLTLSSVASSILNAASFVLNAAFNLVPTSGWITPPSPSPGSASPPAADANIQPPTPLTPRVKPTPQPFLNKKEY